MDVCVCVCEYLNDHFSKHQVSYFLPACSCLCCSWTPSTAWWKSNTAEEGERGHTLSHTSEKGGLTHTHQCARIPAVTPAFPSPPKRAAKRQRWQDLPIWALSEMISLFSQSSKPKHTEGFLSSSLCLLKHAAVNLLSWKN